MDPYAKLNNEDGDLLPDVHQYHRLIGRLLYLTISRPNIAFCVNKLSQCVSKLHNIIGNTPPTEVYQTNPGARSIVLH